MEGVVFGALDWGLGHATRSVPLIRYIQQKGGQVSIAASGPTAELLKNECPEAEFLDLPGYGITYPGQGRSFRGHLLRQIPTIRQAIREEGEWLRKAQGKGRWGLVISDNRYGFRLPGVPSAILTHQLAPISGLGQAVDGLFRRTLYHYINRFSECWVPDLPGEPSLAGQLSHPRNLPRIPVRYLGLLSRFSDTPPVRHPSDHLFLLSGPEPQRSILEQRILRQWARLPGQKVLVRGLPGVTDIPPAPPDTRIFNHLPATELAGWIAGAGSVICRPGYSSLMDLLRLQRPALLIPTPGQTEQEYLAQRCLGLRGFHAVAQDELDLLRDISQPSPEGATFPPDAFDHFKKVIDAFVF
jgi:UDP:flavonoid glycosyltransferase YjiC (YdhE family)